MTLHGNKIRISFSHCGTLKKCIPIRNMLNINDKLYQMFAIFLYFRTFMN